MSADTTTTLTSFLPGVFNRALNIGAGQVFPWSN